MSYAAAMKTLTIRLPDSLLTEIERESLARRISKSDIVRERLQQPNLKVAGRAGTWDLVGDILEAGWKAEVPATPPHFRSLKKQKLARIIRAKKLHR